MSDLTLAVAMDEDGSTCRCGLRKELRSDWLMLRSKVK